jgi:SAM-dependent methyltransferase
MQKNGPADLRIAKYYDWLSRYQRLLTWLGHRGGFDPLTVHRLLVPDRAGVDPADVVHDHLRRALDPMRNPRTIDAGCGVGGTIFYLHARFGGHYDGLTLSRVQCARARSEARRRGVAEDCRFHVRSFAGALHDLAPDGADLVVAIESLAHAIDPPAAIAQLASILGIGGRLAIVDDVPSDALTPHDEDFAGFREGWSCTAVAAQTTLENAIAAAGLRIEHDEDLTPMVPLRAPDQLERLISSNMRWRRWLGDTAPGAVARSLYGGLMLERLYRRGLMRYRLLIATKERKSLFPHP